MLLRLAVLLALILLGATVAVLFAPRLRQLEASRLAKGFLVGVVAMMLIRVTAYVLANVFGLMAIRPLSTGPFDPTNLMVGGLYGIAIAQATRGGFDAFLRHPELLLAVRVATGGAFVLAGLSSAFRANAAAYFVQVGYTETFHRFIMTAEVLGGAAILLPWRWLTLAAVAGLTIDMLGAQYSQLRAGHPLDAAAYAMLFRLAPLAVLSLDRRWIAIGVGAVACAATAIAGSIVLYHPQP